MVYLVKYVHRVIYICVYGGMGWVIYYGLAQERSRSKSKSKSKSKSESSRPLRLINPSLAGACIVGKFRMGTVRMMPGMLMVRMSNVDGSS